MLVFWKERLVFLAVPKTGTTAIEGALAPRASMVLRDPPEIKHSPVYRYGRFLKPFFEKAGHAELETLAIVRHPVDWLGSWYRYRAREEIADHPNSTRGISFDAFVEDYCRGKKPPHAAVGSQARFLLDGAGRVGVDHLFRYESRQGLLDFLQQRLGAEIDLSAQRNVSPAMELSLSPRVEAKLKRKCAEEFEVWENGR